MRFRMRKRFLQNRLNRRRLLVSVEDDRRRLGSEVNPFSLGSGTLSVVWLLPSLAFYTRFRSGKRLLTGWGFSLCAFFFRIGRCPLLLGAGCLGLEFFSMYCPYRLPQGVLYQGPAAPIFRPIFCRRRNTKNWSKNSLTESPPLVVRLRHSTLKNSDLRQFRPHRQGDSKCPDSPEELCT